MCIGHFSKEVPAQQATHHIVLSCYHESWSKADEHKCRGSAQVEIRVSLVAYCPQRPRERVGWSCTQAHHCVSSSSPAGPVSSPIGPAEDLLLHVALPPTGSFFLLIMSVLAAPPGGTLGLVSGGTRALAGRLGVPYSPSTPLLLALVCPANVL